MALILLRADADAAIGLGHVMRCLAVVEALHERGHGCRLATTGLPAALASRLEQEGVALSSLPGPPGGPADRQALVDLIRALGPDALILDGYGFDDAYRAAAAAALRDAGGPGRPVRVLAFDDLGDRDALHADVVVNPSPAAAGLPYARIAPGARLLLGPAHAPIRREIRHAAAATPRPMARRTDLLLTFGGSDPLGLTAPCIGHLAPGLPPGCRLVAVVGAGSPHADACTAAAARHPGRVAVLRDVQAMGALMAGAGLAVAAAGGTVAELAAMGVPSLLAVVADNQAPSAGPAAAAGWCRSIDARGNPAAAAARLAAEALALWHAQDTRTAMAAAAAGLVDGQGAVRIAAALLPPTPSQE